VMISALFTLLFSSSALVVAQSLSSSCTRTYTAQSGDYCNLISQEHNVSTYQFAVANYQTINDGCTNLHVNQTYCLGLTGADCQSTYTVVAGDYCYAIGAKFGVNTTMLLVNNPQILSDCSNIYVGEVLCISNSTIVTPAPAGWTLPGSDLDDGSDATASASASTTATSTASITTFASTTATTTTAAASSTTTAGGAGGVSNAVTDDGDDDDDADDDDDDDCSDD